MDARFCQKIPKIFERMASQRRYRSNTKVLAIALKSGPPVERGVDDAPSEANFKTKASK
jgi:hypothetical protein